MMEEKAMMKKHQSYSLSSPSSSWSSSKSIKMKRLISKVRFSMFVVILVLVCLFNGFKSGGVHDDDIDDSSAAASADLISKRLSLRHLLSIDEIKHQEKDEQPLEHQQPPQQQQKVTESPRSSSKSNRRKSSKSSVPAGRQLASSSAENVSSSTLFKTTTASSSKAAAAAAAADDVAKCVRPDIEQFPKSILNRTQRLYGGVIFYLAVAIYMFVGLAIICDDYFVPSLELICKVLKLREDVAGATFMAAGSSAPELATSIISLFIAKDVDIGIGTVVGSAVFNIMFVISIVALLSGMIIYLNWYPIFRDSFCYLVSILAMILIIVDEKVYWYEAVILLVLYALYILVMYFNQAIEGWTYAYFPFMDNSKKPDSIQIEGSNYNTLNNDQAAVLSSVNNFNNSSRSSSINNDAQSTGNDPENFDSALDKNGDGSMLFHPLKFPDQSESTLNKLKYFVTWPLTAACYYTIPNCRKAEHQKHYLITFAMSLVWLCIYSYVMVWMITVIGYTFLIPDTVMGITLIAFGASVPDALASLLVAKNGQGDMAISNAIGSNVFDILICLGLPWLMRCLTIAKADHISVKSKGLTYSTITLFGTVIILVAAIRFNRWQLDKKIGIFLMFIYVLFILLTSLYELNIIGSNHLPMCTDSNW